MLNYFDELEVHPAVIGEILYVDCSPLVWLVRFPFILASA